MSAAVCVEHTLLLVAGLPGTGKSAFCDLVRELHPEFQTVSIDATKEAAFDRFGFTGIEQKEQVEQDALAEFFRDLDHLMATGVPIVSEHPFSDKQRGRLAALCERHGYRPLTVRFTAALPVLFERQHRRDLDARRHPGHILTTYSRGDQPGDRRAAAGILSWEEFERRCLTRGYGDFRLGPLLEVDTTDFTAVRYPEIVAWVEAHSATR